MRSILLFILISAAGPADASEVAASCQREGKTLAFVDGLAFESVRTPEGRLTTALYLTTQPIDRGKLARCTACAADVLPDDIFADNPREDAIEQQLEDVRGGWFLARYTGGDMDMTSVDGVYYYTPEAMSGIGAGNEEVTFEVNDGKRMRGTLSSRDPADYWGATCTGRFDLPVEWPKP